MSAQLTAITRYPVKSFRGEDLDAADVEPWGLAGDRRWMVVDEAGLALTAREVNAMVLLRARLIPGGVVLDSDGHAPMPVDEPDGDPVEVSMHRNPLVALSAGPAAQAWLTEVLGRPSRLLFQTDPTSRAINPRFSTPEDRVSLADGYPLMVTTEESLVALNDLIAERHQGDHAALPMSRFRPNLVVAGHPAWSEDGWRRIRIGDAVFRAVKGCERCVMTTVDPETAARGKEPIATLARHRRFDGLTWFGMNLIPDTTGVTVRVGDPVEILESVDPASGPPR